MRASTNVTPAGIAVAALAAAAVLAVPEIAAATTDTTFDTPLDTVEDIVGGTGGQLAAALAVGPTLLGLAANSFVPGLVAGVGGWLLLRRAKRGGGANVARFALNWFLPDFVLRLKATPPSHIRRFAG